MILAWLAVCECCVNQQQPMTTDDYQLLVGSVLVMLMGLYTLTMWMVDE